MRGPGGLPMPRRRPEPKPERTREQARGARRLRTAARAAEPRRQPDPTNRRTAGTRVVARPREDRPAPDSLRELAFLDRINEIGPADQLDGADSLPRLYDEDYAVLALLDRAGLAPRSMIGRAVFPKRTRQRRHRPPHQAPPSRADRPAHDRPARARPRRRQAAAALLAHPPRPRGRADTPARAGDLPRREWRAIEQPHAGRLAHDLHALGWAIELHRIVGKLATDHWRTPRYATGRYPVPQTGSGQRRHPITLNEIPVPDGQAIIDLELKTFTEVKPDLSLELRIDTLEARPSTCSSSSTSPPARPTTATSSSPTTRSCAAGASPTRATRPRARGPRSCSSAPTRDAALACAREADAALTGRIGMMGTSAEHWYYAGRDHMFFAVEADIHHGDLSALALPPRPPGLRERLTGSRELALTRVTLLPDQLVKR